MGIGNVCSAQNSGFYSDSRIKSVNPVAFLTKGLFPDLLVTMIERTTQSTACREWISAPGMDRKDR